MLYIYFLGQYIYGLRLKIEHQQKLARPFCLTFSIGKESIMDEKYELRNLIGATEIMRHVLADCVGIEVENMIDLNGVFLFFWPSI